MQIADVGFESPIILRVGHVNQAKVKLFEPGLRGFDFRLRWLLSLAHE